MLDLKRIREDPDGVRAALARRDPALAQALEEVLELDHALGGDAISAIRTELADLLLHLAFQLVIAEERQEFTADQVADELEAKMRRRHPHLFQMGQAEPWEAVLARLSRKP